MGAVVEFPKAIRATRGKINAGHNDCATVIILPVVRIERYSDQPEEREPSSSQRRRRRRHVGRT